jgi:hypothetical protein
VLENYSTCTLPIESRGMRLVNGNLGHKATGRFLSDDESERCGSGEQWDGGEVDNNHTLNRPPEATNLL